MKGTINCKKVILTLLAIVAIGSNSVVYANKINQEATQTKPTQSEQTPESLAELYHKAGLDSPEVIINTLANLGISNEELEEYVGQGKKIYDILQDKEITMINFKKALTKEYKCRIKEATKNKVITRKEAKVLTELLKERMASWQV